MSIPSGVDEALSGLPPGSADPTWRVPAGFFCRWYQFAGRDFPWRGRSISAFHVLLAEVLLRQSLADSVVPVWRNLVQAHSRADTVAATPVRHLEVMLRPIGLAHQRAGALVELSKALCRDYAGRVPESVAELLTLPHVGVYVAHAVACFAFGSQVAVVDTNVLRVFARLTGSEFGRTTDVHMRLGTWRPESYPKDGLVFTTWVCWTSVRSYVGRGRRIATYVLSVAHAPSSPRARSITDKPPEEHVLTRPLSIPSARGPFVREMWIFGHHRSQYRRIRFSKGRIALRLVQRWFDRVAVGGARTALRRRFGRLRRKTRPSSRHSRYTRFLFACYPSRRSNT